MTHEKPSGIYLKNLESTFESYTSYTQESSKDDKDNERLLKFKPVGGQLEPLKDYRGELLLPSANRTSYTNEHVKDGFKRFWETVRSITFDNLKNSDFFPQQNSLQQDDKETIEKNKQKINEMFKNFDFDF